MTVQVNIYDAKTTFSNWIHMHFCGSFQTTSNCPKMQMHSYGIDATNFISALPVLGKFRLRNNKPGQ